MIGWYLKDGRVAQAVSQNLSINSNLGLKAALQAGVHLLWCLTFTDCIPFVRVEAHWFHLHPVSQKEKKISMLMGNQPLSYTQTQFVLPNFTCETRL